jgi:methylmalonyl-CoA mutase N-terminal domain/subunit
MEDIVSTSEKANPENPPRNDAYWETPHRLRTGSGQEVEPFYAAGDLPEASFGDPGEFPYVRGLYANGYRGRLWTRREIAGFGLASDTNERFHYLIEHGAGGLNCHFDLPTHLGIDPDHPLADGDIGGAGPSVCILQDMRDLVAGLPLDRTSMSLISSTNSAVVLLPMYALVAQQAGVSLGDLRGTIQNDPLHARFCGYRASCPVDLGVKLAVDLMEFCNREMPQWYTNNINMYDLREQGITAAQELAFGFALAFVYLDQALQRDVPFETVAGRLAYYCALHNDLLEEVAKLRAARLMWARLLVDRYGADPEGRAVKFRIGSQTAGSTLVPQQPLNNLIRIAYQALIGALAGVSSIHCCGFDEAIGLPSEVAHKLALRTQQILAYETGVAAVADPLGGSYYIENMTQRIADDAYAVLDEIAAQGGMVECVRSGWLEDQLATASLAQVREIESGERRVVGVNCAVESEPERETPGGPQVFSMEANDRRIGEIKAFKASRDEGPVVLRLKTLHDLARNSNDNLIPHVQQALAANATLGEILGTIRTARGLPYDPIGVIEDPFGGHS